MTNLDTYLTGLRNRADAKTRGVVAPPMEIDGTAATSCLQEVDDARTLLAWVAADVTHSVGLDTSGASPVFALLVSGTAHDTVAIAPSGAPAPTATQRASLRANTV